MKCWQILFKDVASDDAAQAIELRTIEYLADTLADPAAAKKLAVLLRACHSDKVLNNLPAPGDLTLDDLWRSIQPPTDEERQFIKEQHRHEQEVIKEQQQLAERMAHLLAQCEGVITLDKQKNVTRRQHLQAFRHLHPELFEQLVEVMDDVKETFYGKDSDQEEE